MVEPTKDAQQQQHDVVRQAVATFQRLAEIPTVSSARFVGQGSRVGSCAHLTLSSRSFASLSRHTRRCSLLFHGQDTSAGNSTSGAASWIQGAPPVDASEDPIKAIFDERVSGREDGNARKRHVVLREANAKGKQTRQKSVEIWRGERLLRSVDVTEKHEGFIVNDTFGSFAFSGETLMYTAQAKPPKRASTWTSPDWDKPQDRLKAYDYDPSLGERFTDQDHPAIFLLRLHSDEQQKPDLFQLKAWDSDLLGPGALLGQASICDEGNAIVLLAHSPIQDGRRLGTFACTNRPSAIYKIDLDSEMLDSLAKKRSGEGQRNDGVIDWSPHHWIRLSRENFSARSPRVLNRNGTVLSWLESEEGGAHRDCDALMIGRGNDKNPRVAIPIQDIPDKTSGWPGIFADELPRHCTLDYQGRLAVVFTTIWGSRRTIAVHFIDGASDVMDVTPSTLCPTGDRESPRGQGRHTEPWSYTLLCTDGFKTLLAVRSHPAHPQQVLVGHLEESLESIQWSLVKQLADDWHNDSTFDGLQQVETSIVPIQRTVSAALGDVAAEAIVARHSGPSSASTGSATPCVMIPHGGPHGASTTDFSPGLATLLLAGYTVVQPNYHGSLGRGQQFAHALIGHCGTLDVQDCRSCIEELIETKSINKGPLFVDGGSHGGFLALHLIGQFPSDYAAAIVRNPVTAANIMDGTNDIPDWFYAEFGHSFDFGEPPACVTSEQLETLARASPLAHLHKICAPVLLLVGEKDQRVAPSQSKLVYHALLSRARRQQAKGNTGPAQQDKAGDSAYDFLKNPPTAISGKKDQDCVRMLTFGGDGHALDSVEAELVACEARFQWLVYQGNDVATHKREKRMEGPDLRSSVQKHEHP